jgi:hypothetical protein
MVMENHKIYTFEQFCQQWIIALVKSQSFLFRQKMAENTWPYGFFSLEKIFVSFFPITFLLK